MHEFKNVGANMFRSNAVLIAYQFYNGDMRYWRCLDGIHEEGDCQSPLQDIFFITGRDRKGEGSDEIKKCLPGKAALTVYWLHINFITGICDIDDVWTETRRGRLPIAPTWDFFITIRDSKGEGSDEIKKCLPGKVKRVIGELPIQDIFFGRV